MPLATAATAATMKIDLSVVILNWNARDYLVACLNSIEGRSWRRAIEVIVVDNDSNVDDSVAMVRRDFPQIELVVNPRNVGFAAGNNIGLRHAHGRYVLFLNPDTEVHDDAFDILVDWMDAHPRAGSCGPKLLNPDGSLQPSCRAFPSIGAGFFRNTPLGRLFPGNPWTRSYLMQDFAHDRAAQVDWLSGSALLTRRETLDQCGAWDEAYFMYCEDVDLCYRQKTSGWERWYVPEAIITHRIGASSDWAQGAMIRNFHRSMLRFFLKNYAHGPSLALIPLAATGIGMRALGAVLNLYWRYLRTGLLKVILKRKLKER